MCFFPRPPVGDMYNQEGDPSEPEWVKTERDQFTEFRDKNKDGKMDKDETRDWILPSDYDHADAEAKHLVYESDTDKVRAAMSVNLCVSQLMRQRISGRDDIAAFLNVNLIP